MLYFGYSREKPLVLAVFSYQTLKTCTTPRPPRSVAGFLLESHMITDRSHEEELCEEFYKSPKSGKTARSVFGARQQDIFLRGYLLDIEDNHTHDNEPGFEDWRDAEEISQAELLRGLDD